MLVQLDQPVLDDDTSVVTSASAYLRECLFLNRMSLRDDARLKAIKPDIKYPKKGMFNRVHTIKEAVEKKLAQDAKSKQSL